MKPDRLNTLTDGLIVIIITIMVLELKVRSGHDLAAPRNAAPLFPAYVLSYIGRELEDAAPVRTWLERERPGERGARAGLQWLMELA